MDYCNSWLYGITARIQRIKNCVARVFLHIHGHITPAVNILHRLFVCRQVAFKIALRVEKALHSDPDSKVHGANMGTIWGRQDPGGSHVGPMEFAIWGGTSPYVGDPAALHPMSQNALGWQVVSHTVALSAKFKRWPYTELCCLSYVEQSSSQCKDHQKCWYIKRRT